LEEIGIIAWRFFKVIGDLQFEQNISPLSNESHLCMDFNKSTKSSFNTVCNFSDLFFI
jgi:hypothetical protein